MTEHIIPALAGSALGLLVAAVLLLLTSVAITAIRERRRPPDETRIIVIGTPSGFASHVAARCRHCSGYVPYQVHPEGRSDALALHRQFECVAVREGSRK